MKILLKTALQKLLVPVVQKQQLFRGSREHQVNLSKTVIPLSVIVIIFSCSTLVIMPLVYLYIPPLCPAIV